MRNLSSKLFFACLTILFLSGTTTVLSCQTFDDNLQTEYNQKPTEENMIRKLNTLKDLTWKNRIILVREKTDEGLNQLNERRDEITERDVIWFRLENDEIKTNYRNELSENFADYLRKNYFDKFAEEVFLVGKDGTIKSKDKKLNLKDYFDQIDSMSMRQREMEKN